MDFAQPIAPGGYVWWYVDALSDDGKHGLTFIAFIGSVFSPYYAFARKRGAGDPENHCALNVALYGPRGKRWAMTERGRAGLYRDVATLAIGPSDLSWDGTALTFRIDEVTVPLPSRIRGTVRLYPSNLTNYTAMLDAEGLHRWSPLAPSSRIEVELQQPALQWNGSAYLDSNCGDGPLEDTFASWNWSRAGLRNGAAVLYDVARCGGERQALALRFDHAGAVEEMTQPPPVELRKTFWRMPRTTRADAGAASIVKTLEDAPFYSRSILATCLQGEMAVAVHESLSLDRFTSLPVQLMLPFRMPRRRK